MKKKYLKPASDISIQAPSEQLIRRAGDIGFSDEELEELRSIYCFAMDGRAHDSSREHGPENMGEKAA